MSQFFKKIIISVIVVAIFMAPISAGIKIDKKNNLALNIETKKAKAASIKDIMGNSTIQVISANSNSVTFTANLMVSEGYQDDSDPEDGNIDLYYNIAGNTPEEGIYITVVDPVTKEVPVHMSLKGFKLNPSFDTTKTLNVLTGTTGTGASALKPETTYEIAIQIDANSIYSGWTSATETFTTTKYNPKDPTDGGASGTTVSSGEGTQDYIGSCIGYFYMDIPVCVAGLTYLIWEISAFIARMAGHFLDFFVYYSTNSSSYKNEFINQGWSAVRDIANIFFIIALLYIAIKTVLGLNVTNNKKLISMVILIALIINFSLFTTKVVIDGSNILAKIFYNNITSKDASAPKINGELQDSKAEAGGEKSISIGIIQKINPQKIVSKQIYDMSKGTFIFITLLATLVTLYTAYVFFSVALLFATRVASLWMYMIFSPIAFASLTVPFNIPGFGYKDWWTNLIESAILAPLFIFFLYIIILFTGFLNQIIQYPDIEIKNMEQLFQFVMSVTIPFVMIVILLKKAKGLAVTYSGELGKGITTLGAMAGGLALGAATGGTAMLGKTIIGGGGGFVANKLAEVAEKRGMGRTATKLRDVSDFARKSSFDVRGVKVAGQSLASVTGMKVGETQKGGWTDMKKKQVEKRQKRADELEKRGTGKEKDTVADAEIKLKEETLKIVDPAVLRPVFAELGGLTAKAAMEALDKKMDKARIDLNDAKNAGDIVGVANAKRDLDAAKDQKDDIRNQNSIASGGTGSIIDNEKDIRKAKDKLLIKSEGITTTYANKIKSDWSKIPNQIFKLGAYSRAGADEAARKIRTGTKLDSGEKPH